MFLEHVANDLSLLKELSDSLVPNGRILINVPVNEGWEDLKHVSVNT